eukprot:7902431-Alexandrium_andersonii.AAC.1
MDTAGAESRVSVSDRVRAIEAGGDSEPSDKRARITCRRALGELRLPPPQRPAPSLRRGHASSGRSTTTRRTCSRSRTTSAP